MKSLQSLCKSSNFPTTMFVLSQGMSLGNIYATSKDWETFLNADNGVDEPFANALSHYNTNDNSSRITYNSVFFTDSTSGLKLLNPRFTYLVNKSNESLRAKFPDVHKNIKVISKPTMAANIENYYTEQSSGADFFLYISYISEFNKENPPKAIKIVPDTEQFIKSLKSSMRLRGTGTDTSLLSDEKIKIYKMDLENCEQKITALQELQDKLSHYIGSIDGLLIGRKTKVTGKTLEKIVSTLPENLRDTVRTLIKDGYYNNDKIKVSVFTPQANIFLREGISDLIQSAYNKLYSSKQQIEDKLNASDTQNTSKDKELPLEEYINALSKRMEDIYKFVTEKPYNSKGKIPNNILTEFRNKRVLMYVLCPTANDSHRCMGVTAFFDDKSNKKYSFNAAGTTSTTYSVIDGSIIIS